MIPQVVTDALNAYAAADTMYDENVVAMEALREELAARKQAVANAESAVEASEETVEESKTRKAVVFEALVAAIKEGFGTP